MRSNSLTRLPRASLQVFSIFAFCYLVFVSVALFLFFPDSLQKFSIFAFLHPSTFVHSQFSYFSFLVSTSRIHICTLDLWQGGITCGAIDEPRKFSKAIDERVIINFLSKKVVIARFRDKNVVIARVRDKNVVIAHFRDKTAYVWGLHYR